MNELAKALAKAQAEIGAASKSSTNPHFKSKYADLSEVWAAWQSVGPKNGLSIVQAVKPAANGGQALVTTLLHESGESMLSEMLLTPTKPDMQGIGSAITYARRYCMAAMVGIVQEDDDANAASSGANQQSTPAPRAAAPKPADDPKAVKAREAYTRLRDAITAADSAEKVDAILKLQAATLTEIQEQSQTGHDQIMQLALARKDALSQKKAA